MKGFYVSEGVNTDWEESKVEPMLRLTNLQVM